MLGAPVAGVTPDAELTADVRERLLQAQRPKDAVELERMRRAAAATAAGFAVAAAPDRARPDRAASCRSNWRPEFFRHGGDRTAFGTIVGTGPDAGVLHFTPGAREVRDGDAVLIDAGAEVGRYAADVTRT